MVGNKQKEFIGNDKFEVLDADYIVIDPNYDYNKASKINSMLYLILTAILAIILSLVLTSCSDTNATGNDVIKAPIYPGSVLSISSYTDELVFSPYHLATSIGNESFEFNLDLSDSIVNQYWGYPGHNMINYTRVDEKGNSLGIDTLLEIKDTIDSNDTEISESVSYKELKSGVLLVKQDRSSNDVDYFHSDMVNIINETGYFEAGSKNDFILDIEGLGVYQLSNIFRKDTTFEVFYKNGEGVRITDMSNTTRSILIDLGDATEFEEYSEYDIREHDNYINIQTSKGYYKFNFSNDELKQSFISITLPSSMEDQDGEG